MPFMDLYESHPLIFMMIEHYKVARILSKYIDIDSDAAASLLGMSVVRKR